MKYDDKMLPSDRKELERLDKEVEQRYKARQVKKKFWNWVKKFFHE